MKKSTVLKRNSTPPQKKETKKTEITINLKAIKVKSTEKCSKTPKSRRMITKSKSMSTMELANEQQKQLLKVFDDSPIKEEDEEQLCSDVRGRESEMQSKRSPSMEPIVATSLIDEPAVRDYHR